jgi:hypothetical protein
MAALSARVAAALAVAAVVSCGSPNPVLYTLSVVPAATRAGGPAVVSIREVSIARYLERPQIVRSADGNRLDVRANEWWGEPLAPMLTRVLAEDLSQRLPNSVVFGENGAINSTADVVVAVNVERMDAAPPQSVALVAHTAVIFTNGKGRPILRTVRLETPAPTGDTVGAVAAMSAAVGQLADGIADLLTTRGAGS